MEGTGLINPEEEETWDAGGIRESLWILRMLYVEEQATKKGRARPLFL